MSAYDRILLAIGVVASLWLIGLGAASVLAYSQLVSKRLRRVRGGRR